MNKDNNSTSNGSSRSHTESNKIEQGSGIAVSKNREFTVVGMGGSAGSLEAVEEFLGQVPADCGIAFVLVQHLDPDYKSSLADILQRCTHMPVVRVEDGMNVEPNHVYVIPENKELGILNGTLLLMEPSKPRGFRMPIDTFFQSLAQDWGEKAVCIIFSGMGSDGELGARFIKEGVGLVIVQDPTTAKYDSMPRSAIQTGTADYIEPPKKIASKLIEYVKYPAKHVHKKDGHFERTMASALQKIFILLRSQTGHDFSLYKRNTLMRRFERRMQTHQLVDIEAYVRLLQEDAAEVKTLFKELLIGVTKFFRDPQAFHILEEKVLPELLSKKGKNESLRVWIAGCSTGEEAYSVAILIRECIHKLRMKHEIKMQIYATDLDPEAIKLARAGVFFGNISNDVSPERLERWFIKKDDRYQITQEIRETVVFADHNLLKDACFTKLDLLCCRNLLIYFSHELQKKLLPMFHYTLNPGGFIFLGPSETISGHENLFSTVDAKWKIYKRQENTSSVHKIGEFPTHSATSSRLPLTAPIDKVPAAKKQRTLPNLINQLLLEKHTPASVLINIKGDILYINGRTGKFLEPSSGQASMNVYEMAREGLAFELRNAVLRSSSLKEKTVINELKVKTNGDYSLIRLTVEPVLQPEEMKGLLLVLFEELPPSKKERKPEKALANNPEKDKIIADLENELRATRDHLQQTIEEMETSLEELKSTNEELQSTNEEMQSANEEANTAKEETQALNEELMTVNMEFRAKTEELTETNNDMANLLNSSDIATIFLNHNLEIKRFTNRATKIVNLIQSDIGRSITHISSNLKYDALVHDVQEVLEQLKVKETQVEAKNGQWFAMRISPYRTLDNFIAGAVITFMDITLLKRLETELKAALQFNENIIDTVRDPLIVLNEALHVELVSRSFLQFFQVSKEQILGKHLFTLGNGQWDIPTLHTLLSELLVNNSVFNDYLVEHHFPGIGYKKLLLNARRLVQLEVGKEFILLAMEEVKER
jgi:two-component system CheB/CheR fusion protein